MSFEPQGVEALAEAFHRLYIGAVGAGPRQEDRKKLEELSALLSLLSHALPRRRSLVGVDAAAGKAYVGLLLIELVLARRGQAGSLHIVERDPRRVALCAEAAQRARAPGWDVAAVAADVADPAAWPRDPDFVVALHACGPASDAILDAAIAARARRLFLVPCCTSQAVSGMPAAESWAERVGIPAHAEVRRPFLQSMVDAERTLRLEAAGYETVVVPFVPKSVTPFNLLWHARRVGEPGRMRAATDRLQRLRSG